MVLKLSFVLPEEIEKKLPTLIKLHACIYIYLILTTSAQPLLPNTKAGCSKGASFMSKIHVHGKGLIKMWRRCGG